MDTPACVSELWSTTHVSGCCRVRRSRHRWRAGLAAAAGVAFAALLAGCGGGSGSTGAAPADGPTAVGGAHGTAPSITIGAPVSMPDARLVGVPRQASGVRFFTTELTETAADPFHSVPGTAFPDIGSGASFERGRVGRFDYPTARVRVRGCSDDGDCVTSNEQPLQDALFASARRLTPGDDYPGGAGFGTRTALSTDGNVLAVSGDGDTSGRAGEPGQGSVLIYRRDAEGLWSREARVQRFDRPVAFGPVFSLSGGGRWLAVGAPTNGGTEGGVGAPEVGSSGPPLAAGDLSGGVYLYQRDDETGSWSLVTYIKAPDPRSNERYGTHVSLDDAGIRLVVASAGRVFVHERFPEGWQTTAVLALPPRSSVAAVAQPALGPWIAVSFSEADETGQTVTRQVRLWELCYTCAERWAPSATLSSDVPPSVAFDDRFGVGGPGDGSKPMAFGGNDVLAVGAPGDSANPGDPSAARQGAIYVFRRDAQGTWRREARLRTRSAHGFDFVGQQVAFSHDGKTIATQACGTAVHDPGLRRSFRAGDTVGPGAPGSLPDCSSETGYRYAGAVYLFERCEDGRWEHAAAWIPEPGRQADFEQQSMSMSGDASTLTYSVGLHDEAVTPRRVVVY